MCPHVSLPDPPNTQTLDLVLKLGSLVPGSARKAVQASVYRGGGGGAYPLMIFFSDIIIIISIIKC